MVFSARHLLIVLGLMGIAVTGQPAQAEPTPEYTLQALVRRVPQPFESAQSQIAARWE